MNSYIFCFGYENDTEREVNDRVGTDYESSAALFIEADSEEEALAWGRKVAEAFVRSDTSDSSPAWSPANYANFIDTPDQWSHCLDFLPRVRVGEYPDFTKMTAAAYVTWCREHGIQ